eukprot:scaffold223321_cov32-Tisochrysis_lutea.AAC.3
MISYHRSKAKEPRLLVHPLAFLSGHSWRLRLSHQRIFSEKVLQALHVREHILMQYLALRLGILLP